jgi:hypothetical protein
MLADNQCLMRRNRALLRLFNNPSTLPIKHAFPIAPRKMLSTAATVFASARPDSSMASPDVIASDNANTSCS